MLMLVTLMVLEALAVRVCVCDDAYGDKWRFG